MPVFAFHSPWGEEMDEEKILERIAVNPKIFGGKPMIRGRRLLLSMSLKCRPRETALKRSSKVTRGLSRKTFRHASSMPAGSRAREG